MIFIINWLIASFLQGMFFFLIMVFFFYWFYIKELPVNRQASAKPQFEQYELNASLREMLDTSAAGDTSSTSSTSDLKGNCDGVIALNMIFHFLFQELKDTKAVRRYIIRKMSAEFKELLTTKAAGKIVQRITAKDFSLGTSFPVIHSLKLGTYQMDHAQKSIQELSVIADLEYTNGFSISIDADLILGRSAYIHIKVVSIKGKARIQFCRAPFTHWSFAFIEDPQIEFDASSHFDGRQIPQLTALILNQLRRSVKRKHTLPNYKCRFKPFFDPVYNQNLFKPNIDELLLRSNSNQEHFVNKQTSQTSLNSDSISTGNNPSSSNKVNLPRSVSNNSISTNEDIALSNIQQQLNELALPLNELDPISDESSKLAKRFSPENKSINSYQYRKLCEKLGFDLTGIGQLVVNFKTCDRLPEALYSLNMPQLQSQSQQQQQQLQSQTSQQQLQVNSSLNTPQPGLPKSASSYSLNTQQDSCFISLTSSVDKISMKSLMSKQICKDHWPLIEFDLVKSSATQTIQAMGLILTEFFLINRNEVVIQRIVPSSQAAAAAGDLVKQFDIIYSINQIRITSLKQLSKLLQKALVNSQLKFIVQRPCILMENKVNSSANGLAIKRPNQLLNSVGDLTKQSSNSALTVPHTNSVSNTRQKLEYLEKKIKFFGSTATANSINSSSNSSEATNPPNVSTPTDTTNSIIQPSTTTTTTVSGLVQSFITASSYCLVDYFCAVSECSTNEHLVDLDLINLLTDRTLTSEEQQKRQEGNFRKSKDIKIEKENLLAFNNVPIQVDETYTFDLNEETSYLNVFLWTTQYTNKMTKMKHLLIGYISLPLHEINVDCWNTSKGETQSTVHFSPLDEYKATAAKLARSHVLSDHPGFDSSLSVGTLTINFQHKLKKETPPSQISSSIPNTNDTNINNSNYDSNTNNPTNDIEIKDLTHTIVEELIEQNNFLTSHGKNENALSELTSDDGSMHKFVSVTFNESVACEFCNKKIWFKNAYQCIYCSYKIHMKCIDRAVGKTICSRFFAKNKDLLNVEEPFEEITTADAKSSAATITNQQEDAMSVNSASSTLTTTTTTSTRSLVSNFFSGIRQRRLNPESQTGFNLLNSFRSKQQPNSTPTTTTTNNSTNNNNLLNDDLISTPDMDEFKDIDSNEEKLFGTELFEELPLDERKVKFDEQINKYQSTIEMMKRMKLDYEKELEMLLKSKKNRMAKTFLNTSVFNQKEERLRAEIKHTDEQMKCVMFLLMQCQIGLSNCTDLQASNSATSNQAFSKSEDDLNANKRNNNPPLDLVLNEDVPDRTNEVNSETNEFVQL